jgi:sodium/hydrogen antiporter
MNDVTPWYIVTGVLFIGLALAGSFVARAPLTPAVLYVGVGILLGPYASGLLTINPIDDAGVLERLSEVAVIVSLFTAGLKLRAPLTNPRWWLALRLAALSMVITVGLVATAVVVACGAPWGVGLVVGAILAPTDPVLASDVQVEHPFDTHRVRFSLTAEASLNDGTAFPFLMLGLGLVGLHDLGEPLWWRWIAVDVVWASVAGLGLGAALGTAVGTLVLYLRRTHREAVGLDDFLALGLIALAYGIALACHAYGFLAVFAAGLALRRVERESSAEAGQAVVPLVPHDPAGVTEVATDPKQAPAHMAQALLVFNEQLERIGEVAVAVVLGALLSPAFFTLPVLWLAPLLLIAIRPVAVGLGLLGSRADMRERGLIAWFGIRGVGSIYYLMFALTHGLPPEVRDLTIGLTLSTVALSIVVHGLSVTPVMARWGERG